MTFEPTLTPYEGMVCKHCTTPLDIEFIPGSASATIRCEACGPLVSVMLTQCRGRTCNERVFFGGKSGRVPINPRTGSSHFNDCKNAANFRRKNAG